MKIIKPLLIFLFLIGCSSKTKRDRSDILKENKSNNMEQVFYGVNCEIATPFKLLINNVKTFQYNGQGSIDFYKPINDLIIESGLQKISIELYPRNGKEFIPKNIGDYLNLEVILSEDLELTKYEKIISCELPEAQQKRIVSMTWTFEAKIPYKINGWKNSMNLLDENKNELLKEVIEQFGYYKSLLEKKDAKTFLSKTKNRDLELAKSLYLSQEEIAIDDQDMIESIKRINKVAKIENYNIIFYANGKIVTLEKNDEESKGESVLQAELIDESTDVYDLLFHRPKEGEPLEVIR